MKKYLYILLLILTHTACDSENGSDCFQTTGNLIIEQRIVSEFSRILVNENVTMIIRQGSSFSVEVEAGENLINDVTVEIIGDQLVLSDTNNCNFFRDFMTTTITVTAPNITEIQSSTQFDIRSEGVLEFPNLTILSEDFSNDEFQNTGNFFLTIENESFNVEFNNLSNCFISGSTIDLDVAFFSGNSRFEGRDLVADTITFFHRGTNDMLFFPTNTLRGDIFSTGDVQVFNRPAIVKVVEHFNGRLIFRD